MDDLKPVIGMLWLFVGFLGIILFVLNAAFNTFAAYLKTKIEELDRRIKELEK